MKWRTAAVSLFFIFIIVVGFSLFSRNSVNVGAQREQNEFFLPPTPDISKEEKSTLEPWPTTPPLPHQLTEGEAIEQALYFDSLGVQWRKPWSIETLTQDPDRINIQLYENRTEAAKSSGRDISYTSDLETDAGEVWAISIKGEVDVSFLMPSMSEGQFSDGVTYEISARTGELLAVRTGPLLEE